MNESGQILLDARLSAIERMTPRCACAADIGADHGYLGVHLLTSGKCGVVQFIDISEPSLRKAGRLVRRLGLEERALFSVGDGAQALVRPADVAIVAGMGGATIAGIVARGREALKDSLLILQPNVAVDELRARLVEEGFCIVDEELARAGGRHYVIIAARRGAAHYDRAQLLVGPVLLEKRHPLLSSYADFRIRVTEKALSGAQNSQCEAAHRLAEELKQWREIRAWLQP